MRNPVTIKTTTLHHPRQGRALPVGSTKAARVRKPTTADQIVQLIHDSGAELFHDPADRPWVIFSSGGHHETWPLDSEPVRQWAAGLLYRTEKKVPSGQAIENALRVLAHRARTDGPEYSVHLRAARDPSGAVHVDLADEDRRVVRVTPDGWEVLSSSPVRFYRASGMLPLPVPERGGHLDLMRPFLNLLTEHDWVLIASWMVQAYLSGPYPILLLLGEQGTAKSTAARLIRSVIDAHVAPLLTLPDRERDLLVGARSCHVSTYDNLSGVRGEVADVLCRLATGGGLLVRRLYTDADPVVLSVMRPILITAISHPTVRGDFLDRTLCVTLPPIPENRRRSETEMWAEFEPVRAQVLGGLLDVLQTVLQNLPSVHLSALPRLADFARIAVAAAPALGVDVHVVLGAIGGSREEAMAVTLEGSLITELVGTFAHELSPWEGTAGELLEQLRCRASETDLRAREFPSSPKALANALRRIAPALRATGIQIEWMGRKGHGNRRCIRITRHIPVPPSENDGDAAQGEQAARNGLPQDDGRRVFVRDLSRSFDFPKLDIRRGETVVAGEGGWTKFLVKATDDQVKRAIAALTALEAKGER